MTRKRLVNVGSYYLEKVPTKTERNLYKSYVSPVILYGSEARCLKENDMGIFRSTERSMVRAMCGMLMSDKKRTKVLALMLGLKEVINQLAMGNLKTTVWSCV